MYTTTFLWQPTTRYEIAEGTGLGCAKAPSSVFTERVLVGSCWTHEWTANDMGFLAFVRGVTGARLGREYKDAVPSWNIQINASGSTRDGIPAEDRTTSAFMSLTRPSWSIARFDSFCLTSTSVMDSCPSAGVMSAGSSKRFDV
jgi:hypothetical protein